ncbi:glycosyltransferase [Acetobacter farinalis]|uniref:Glycosyltransferase n=1 Tax=Acetobacter farinalis TaxID=1260984 RepID=A0ABT3Q773_9PROT|nr:glycosyltransferase [Acetobacter farinalis]MCX2561129.1 glycosyltransferase [Acetobacter farinalis]NHO29622.1 glycosyltransferase [Acetobacter farinalis]
MTVVIMTVGTEGDIRPHIALGAGLAARGHSVRLAADPGFAPAITQAGLEFAPLTADFAGMMRRHPQALDGRSGAAVARVVVEETRRMAQHWPEEGMAAAKNATLLIGSGNVTLLAASLAERAGVPFIQTQLQPLEASRALPPVWFRPHSLPGSMNLMLHHALRQTAWLLTRSIANNVREKLHLSPYGLRGPWHDQRAKGTHILYGFSQHVVPRQPEWPERIAMPGYFIAPTPTAWQPPPDLEAFLKAGEKPVYIGFGSMLSSEAARLASMVQEAVQRSGLRAVVGSGWSGLKRFLDNTPDLHVVDSIPHEWLFQRVRLAVHHCGAGTAAAAVRAGIPTVPVPFVGDQFFWGWQLGRIGVATPAQAIRTMSASTLAEALRQATHPAMVQAAARLGQQVRAEDGVARAIKQMADWRLLEP